MSSGSLSGSTSGRMNASGDRVPAATVQSSGGAAGGSSTALVPSGARGGGGGGGGAGGGGGGYTSSPGHSPASGAQRQPQGMVRQGPRQHRGAHDHRPNQHQHQQSYDQGRGGGVDGVMMRDGRFVPAGAMDGGGHPGMTYGEGGGYGGYGDMGGGGGGGGPGGMMDMMDIPWGGQDPVALYQALLMKQSLAAAHASGMNMNMRFPNMNMPAGNGMGMNMNMVDMAALAAAAQAASASGGRGGYGGAYVTCTAVLNILGFAGCRYCVLLWPVYCCRAYRRTAQGLLGVHCSGLDMRVTELDIFIFTYAVCWVRRPRA